MDTLGIETLPRRFRGAVQGIGQSRREMRIIRSMPVGFFDAGKPVMPLVPDKFFLLHPDKRDAVIRQLWRKHWRAEVLTPWYKGQVKPQESCKRDLGSTTKMRTARVITGWV